MRRATLRQEIAHVLSDELDRKVSATGMMIGRIVDIAERHADDILASGRKKKTVRATSATDDVERSLYNLHDCHKDGHEYENGECKHCFIVIDSDEK